MKTETKQQLAPEIETKKRLRLICEWFAQLSDKVATAEPDRGLRPATIALIDAQGFERADLCAIRSTPGKWTLKNPYQWLWLLHRYQNGNHS